MNSDLSFLLRIKQQPAQPFDLNILKKDTQLKKLGNCEIISYPDKDQPQIPSEKLIDKNVFFDQKGV